MTIRQAMAYASSFQKGVYLDTTLKKKKIVVEKREAVYCLLKVIAHNVGSKMFHNCLWYSLRVRKYYH